MMVKLAPMQVMSQTANKMKTPPAEALAVSALVLMTPKAKMHQTLSSGSESEESSSKK